MEDDLDDLLDEVETKFCRNISLPTQSTSSLKVDRNCMKLSEGKGRAHGASKQEAPKRPDNDDIDALLEEIFDDDDFQSVNLDMPKAGKAGKKDSLPQTAMRKACSQLRCTSCDFRVATFEDHEWDPSCDYLFFRNNMPDCHKLRAKLKRRRGARAYACQCSWHSALALADLRDQHQLKWVCGKHDA